MSTLPSFDAHWWWLIAGVVLAIAEVILPGFFLIWIGVAAIVTGIATLALGLPFAGQFVLFAALAVAAVYAGRRWFLSNPITSTDPMLNDRAARLVGEQVVVTDAIVGGVGRVRVGDGVWRAHGPDAEVGTRLTVTGVDRGVLLVEAAS